MKTDWKGWDIKKQSISEPLQKFGDIGNIIVITLEANLVEAKVETRD